jgi:hypothetical protein
VEVFVFRGLPGSRTVTVARLLLHRPVDHIIDLSDFWERDQGNLFMTEVLPEEAQDEVEHLLRSPQISRLGICGMVDKGWIERIVEEIEVDDIDIHWLVVENAKRPGAKSKKFYERLARTFEVDLYDDAGSA